MKDSRVLVRIYARNQTQEQDRAMKTTGSDMDRVEDWETLAKKAGYRVAPMAAAKGMSVYWFEREFKRQFKRLPRDWLHEVKFHEVQRRRAQGDLEKTIALGLHYAHASSFSRAFGHHAR